MMYEQKQKDMEYTVNKKKNTDEKQSKTLEEGLYRDIRIQRKTNKLMQVQPVIQKEPDEIVDSFISAMSEDDRKQQAAALAPLLCRIFQLDDEYRGQRWIAEVAKQQSVPWHQLEAKYPINILGE